MAKVAASWHSNSTVRMGFIRRIVSLPPELSVEGAVLHGLGDVGDADDVVAREIGDGSRHFQNPVVGPRREVHGRDGRSEQGLRLRLQRAVGANLPGAHVGVAVDPRLRRKLFLRAVGQGGFVSGEAHPLPEPCGEHPRPDRRRGFSCGRRGQLVVFQSWNLYVQVYSVEQRPGNSLEIFVDGGLGAGAGFHRVAVEAARARVHRGDEREAGRVRERRSGAGDGDVAVFERLAQDFQHVSRKLREFV